MSKVYFFVADIIISISEAKELYPLFIQIYKRDKRNNAGLLVINVETLIFVFLIEGCLIFILLFKKTILSIYVFTGSSGLGRDQEQNLTICPVSLTPQEDKS